MNVPPNTRKFSLSLAQQNHPLVTRAGQEAKFIAYVPEAMKAQQLLVLVNTAVYSMKADGTAYNGDLPNASDLFLSPVGYCQELPVFAGDELCVKESSLIFKVPVSAKEYDLSLCKWPSKAPIVETRMSVGEIWAEVDNVRNQPDLRQFANKSIERAILDGDVVPTSVASKLANDAFHLEQSQYINFENAYKQILNDYLEGLK